LTGGQQLPGTAPFIQQMMYLDLVSYLPDDILVKVDRASMAVGLESRAPFLDHHVVEFAWRVPLGLKFRDGRGKWLLRQVLHRHVPAHLFERPKRGLGVPLDIWLRGPLREWAEGLLSPAQLRRDGYFDPMPIGRLWTRQQQGSRRCSERLWGVLMFQAWLRAQEQAPRGRRQLPQHAGFATIGGLDG
jgi:asparagine synthase (glutamine-hydrolysing)